MNWASCSSPDTSFLAIAASVARRCLLAGEPCRGADRRTEATSSAPAKPRQPGSPAETAAARGKPGKLRLLRPRNQLRAKRPAARAPRRQQLALVDQAYNGDASVSGHLGQVSLTIPGASRGSTLRRVTVSPRVDPAGGDKSIDLAPRRALWGALPSVRAGEASCPPAAERAMPLTRYRGRAGSDLATRVVGVLQAP